MKVSSLDIISLASVVRPTIGGIFTDSSSPLIKKLPSFSYTPPCIRVGRCVIRFYSTNTQSIATQERQTMLRTMLQVVAAFFQYIKILQSARSGYVLSRLPLDSLRLIRKKSSRMSLMELYNFVATSAVSSNPLFCAIPRIIWLDFSQNAINLLNYLIVDITTHKQGVIDYKII